MSHTWSYCHRCRDRVLADQDLIHNIEQHGIVPCRPLHRGDPVWVTPTAIDPFRYVVAVARAEQECHHCRATISQGQLHASRPRSPVHYCLLCVGLQFGTPEASQLRRQIVIRECEASVDLAVKERAYGAAR